MMHRAYYVGTAGAAPGPLQNFAIYPLQHSLGGISCDADHYGLSVSTPFDTAVQKNCLCL